MTPRLRPFFLTAVTGLLVAAPLHGQQPPATGPDPLQDLEAWQVRMSRMEGAAGNIEEWAQSVQETTGRILEQGRLTAVAELTSRADELNARVVGAALAVAVLDQPL